MSKTLTASEIETLIADRRAGFSRHYPFILCYVQEFTSGALEGIKRIDSLPFCTEADAEGWVRKINAKQARGAMNYRVTEHAVRALAS